MLQQVSSFKQNEQILTDTQQWNNDPHSETIDQVRMAHKHNNEGIQIQNLKHTVSKCFQSK
jgi:hypothetical protein